MERSSIAPARSVAHVTCSCHARLTHLGRFRVFASILRRVCCVLGRTGDLVAWVINSVQSNQLYGSTEFRVMAQMMIFYLFG